MALKAGGSLYVSASFWVTVASAVMAIVAIWVGYRSTNPKRRLRCAMPVVTPLLNTAAEAPSDIEVRRRGRVLADPYVVEVRLTNEGRRDIPSAAFDQQQPLTLDVGAPILEILKPTSLPNRDVPVDVMGTSVKVGPTLIVRGQRISMSLLVDGAAPTLTCPQPPLIDIEIRYGEPPATLWRSPAAAWTVVGVVMGPAMVANLLAISAARTTPLPGREKLLVVVAALVAALAGALAGAMLGTALVYRRRWRRTARLLGDTGRSP